MKILPRDPRVVMVVVFGQIQEAFNCSGGLCTRSICQENMKSWLKEETNGGKSRGVVMIYTSCEPSRTYGVVLIFFYGWQKQSGVVNRINLYRFKLSSLHSIFLREINTTIMIRKRPMIIQDRLILVGLAISTQDRIILVFSLQDLGNLNSQVNCIKR